MKITAAQIVDENALARVAAIMGPQSVSQAILDELAKRRAAGETVVAYDIETSTSKIMVVGPPIDDKSDNMVDGQIDNWAFCSTLAEDLPFVIGNITGDRKKRWTDGTFMTTSMLTSATADVAEGVIITTLNSRYRLGKQAQTITNDMMLYTASVGAQPIGRHGKPITNLTVH